MRYFFLHYYEVSIFTLYSNHHNLWHWFFQLQYSFSWCHFLFSIVVGFYSIIDDCINILPCFVFCIFNFLRTFCIIVVSLTLLPYCTYFHISLFSSLKLLITKNTLKYYLFFLHKTIYLCFV